MDTNKKKKVKLLLFADYMFPYICAMGVEDSTKIPLELRRGFDKSKNGKQNMLQLHSLGF